MPESIEYIQYRDVFAITGLSRRSIDRREEKGLFPKRKKGFNSSVWWPAKAVIRWAHENKNNNQQDDVVEVESVWRSIDDLPDKDTVMTLYNYEHETVWSAIYRVKQGISSLAGEKYGSWEDKIDILPDIWMPVPEIEPT